MDWMKNIEKSVQEYGDIMNQRNTIMLNAVLNEAKANRNWFNRMQQDQMKRAPAQAQMNIQNQGGMVREDLGPVANIGGRDVDFLQTTQGDPMTSAPKPQSKVNQYGQPEMYNPTSKDWIFSRIQLKKRRGIPLSSGESKFEKKYLGVTEKEIKSGQITPTAAINIISDPIKSDTFRKNYPDLYPQVERIARQAVSGGQSEAISQDIAVDDTQVTQEAGGYNVGDFVNIGGQDYEVVELDDNGEPLLKPVE